jgi:valyl-tRNA synthetase
MVFQLKNGRPLPIATTRPELLPACVAVFVHPEDNRYIELVGHLVNVPLFDQTVRIFQDPAVDPRKGTGAVMCCTFGDNIDKQWWYTHQLEHVQVIDQQGKLTRAAGEFSGLSVSEARRAIKTRLDQDGFLLDRQPTTQIIPVHERCETPVEFIMSQQWFIRLLDYKEEFLATGDKIDWHPQHMKTRYRTWVENLAWDWCISRQRYFGIPFPLWYCQGCSEVILADLDQLPVDPTEEQPRQSCKCGSTSFIPDDDILETWATSSLTPQIVGRWLCEDPDSQIELYSQVFPFSLRPQAHEIIRTWAFYTIAKSHFHFKQPPWREVAISGWGIAGEGMGKISKSRGGGPLRPAEMIERYSADAVRFWAVSTGLGKDSVISEEKIQLGAKLITKLWNIARFSERFLAGYEPMQETTLAAESNSIGFLSPADRWILSRLQKLVNQVTKLLDSYEYAAAKSEIENFLWSEFADNYLEMCKQRLYTGNEDQTRSAQFTLYNVLLTLTKLFAPFLPYVTEKVFQGLFVGKEFSDSEKFNSIHLSPWPEVNQNFVDEFAEQVGASLVEIATAVRRHKSENKMSLGSNVEQLLIRTNNAKLATYLRNAKDDLISITRAEEISINNELPQGSIHILESGKINAYLVL